MSICVCNMKVWQTIVVTSHNSGFVRVPVLKAGFQNTSIQMARFKKMEAYCNLYKVKNFHR